MPHDHRDANDDTSSVKFGQVCEFAVKVHKSRFIWDLGFLGALGLVIC